MLWQKTACALGCVMLIFTGCGGASFDGNNGRKNTEKGGADNSQNNGPVRLEGNNLSADDQAINKCLDKFGNHPFNSQQLHNYRRIAASVQVLGIGNGVVDDQPTKEPALILISVAVNVLGTANYKLLNPNGWYCLKVGVNVQATTNIDLQCKAHLADSKVDVSVLSNSAPAGQVGVHVLSTVNINKVGC